MDAFYTLEQAAEKLGLAVSSLRRYISDGNVRAYKRGGRWFIFHSDLAEFVRKGKIN